MSTRLELFYAKRLGNAYGYIYIFLCNLGVFVYDIPM